MPRRSDFVLIANTTDSILLRMIVPVSMWTVLQRLRGGACSSATGVAFSPLTHRGSTATADAAAQCQLLSSSPRLRLDRRDADHGCPCGFGSIRQCGSGG